MQITPRDTGFAGLTNDCPTGLSFRTENGRDVEAGPWAQDLVRVGRMFALAEANPPMTLALSLPVLDFAGPLVAAGFIAERAQRRFDNSASSTVYASERAQLFRQLCELPASTPVLLRQNSGKTVHAAFQRVESLCGEPWAVIRFEKASKGAGREFINEAKAHRVSFSAGLDAEAKEDVIGRTANVRLGLAEGFIADDFAVRDLILCSVSECALIGVVKTLSDELSDVKFVARNQDGSTAFGTLQDIVRAGNLVRSNEFSRSMLFAVKAKAKETAQWSPGLAIFCGSSAYLSQVARFPGAHHTALLSPTERNYESAVNALNEAYLRKLGELPDHNWAVPEGAVAMGFQRRPSAAR